MLIRAARVSTFVLVMVALTPAAAGARGAACAAAPAVDVEALVARSRGDSPSRPYDYQARERLVAACEQAGDYSSAFYQAAWLTWLAPREYAESRAGAQYLHDRRARDRAASAQSARVASPPQGGRPGGPSDLATGIVTAAVDAARHLTESCLNGVIADQAARLQRQTADQIAQAEKAAASLEGRDPVVRMALAQLHLTLDDTLALQASSASRRQRLPALRKAAGQAQAVCDWLPQSPGAHRTLGLVRARMAALENVRELWELAIAECEKAYQLDAKGPTLPELLWTLNLRAGHWEEAERWEAACRPALGPPKGLP